MRPLTMAMRQRRWLHTMAVAMASRVGAAMGQMLEEGQPNDAAGAVVGVEDFEAAVLRVVKKQQSADTGVLPTEALFQAENHWRAERLKETGGRFIAYVDWFWETDAPLLAVTLAVLLLTFFLAYVAPEVVTISLRILRVPERPSRAVTNVIFVFIVGFGIAGTFALFQTGLIRWLITFGVFGLAFGYGLGVEISNVVAGALLPFHPAIEVGKELTLMDNGEKKTGTIETVGLRYTTVIRKRAEGRQDGAHVAAQSPLHQQLARRNDRARAGDSGRGGTARRFFRLVHVQLAAQA